MNLEVKIPIVISIAPQSPVGKYREILCDGSWASLNIKAHGSHELESHLVSTSTYSRPNIRQISRYLRSTSSLLLASIQKTPQNLSKLNTQPQTKEESDQEYILITMVLRKLQAHLSLPGSSLPVRDKSLLNFRSICIFGR